MAASAEYELIARYFTWPATGAWSSPGVGDDCAFVDLDGRRLAITTDMMALGTHFLPDVDPYTCARKALAVNLSDLAAAGASPRAFFLSIALPDANEAWLARFSEGLRDEAREAGCDLLGGDTTKSPAGGYLTLSITALGELPPGAGLRRSGAQAGDDVWVSGTTGDAYAALMVRTGRWTLREDLQAGVFSRMDRPQARWRLGERLRELAHAAADVSDGLWNDLGHLLRSAGLAARIDVRALPVSEALRTLSEAQRLEALAGGDDYELVFTAPPERREAIRQAGRETGTCVTCIGTLTTGAPTLTLVFEDGRQRRQALSGFDHFAKEAK